MSIGLTRVTGVGETTGHVALATIMNQIQCDQIGRNFAIWANFFCLGRNFFQEFIYYWAIFWAKFYLLWANFFPSLFTIGRIFSEIWANFFSNRLVTLFSAPRLFLSNQTNNELFNKNTQTVVLNGQRTKKTVALNLQKAACHGQILN